MKRSISQWNFKKEKIDREYIKLKNMNSRSLREESIIKAYEEYIKDKNDNDDKYYAYQFVQKLLWMRDEEFSEEFGVNDEEGLKELVKFIGGNWIDSLDELRLKAAVAQHTEWSKIYLSFSDAFRLEDVGDEIIAKMLDNLENRIQLIEGSESFIIIHRTSDNNIFKSMITEDNKEDIMQLIQQCNDNQVYDVIIHTEIDVTYEGLDKIRIRYLNYDNDNWGDYIELELQHPEDLVSSSLYKVIIINMS